MELVVNKVCFCLTRNLLQDSLQRLTPEAQHFLKAQQTDAGKAKRGRRYSHTTTSPKSEDLPAIAEVVCPALIEHPEEILGPTAGPVQCKYNIYLVSIEC